MATLLPKYLVEAFETQAVHFGKFPYKRHGVSAIAIAFFQPFFQVAEKVAKGL
jgi:hypothetical protein